MRLSTSNPDNTTKPATYVVLSMGAGVQSTVMALMAAEGLITPMPDVAIFADTQSDAAGIYAHLDWLEAQLPFPLVRATAGSVHDDLVEGVNATGQPFFTVPLYLKAEGQTKSRQGRRVCTSQYKIQVVKAAVRAAMGIPKGGRVPKDAVVHQWIGISTDEVIRADKDPSERWLVNRYPLLEDDTEMDRAACIAWFRERHPERTLAKSSCLACPYRSPQEWLEMRSIDPESFEIACRIDEKVRDTYSGVAARRRERALARIALIEARNARGELTTKGEPFKVPSLPSEVTEENVQQFILRACVPLREIESVKMPKSYKRFGIENECEGMCGL